MRPAVGNPPLAHVKHTGQSRDAGNVMNHNTAGEIQYAPLRQNAAAPDHVDEGEVDEGEPTGQEEHVSLEGHPVSEGSGDQRRGDNGKHHLVGDVDHQRDAGVARIHGAQVDVAQASIVEVADDAVPIAAEAQRVAVEVPDHRGPAHRYEALDHDGQYVFTADKTAVKKGQSWSHQHDQAGAQNHKTGVASVEMGHKGSFHIR